MNENELTSEIQEGITGVAVHPLGDGEYRVTVPNYRNTHDSVVIALTEMPGNRWLISDGGQLAYLLDDDFEKVVEAMECAGAVFSWNGDRAVTLEVTNRESLVPSVLGFSHYLAAAPIVWHSLECAKPAVEAKPTSVELMATETRQRLIERATSRDLTNFVHLKHPIAARGEHYRAPLAVAAKGARRTPPLVASFIDTTAAGQALTSAKRNTSYLFEIVRDWQNTRRYVVVRGGVDALEHFQAFYDHDQINTVSTDNLGTLPQDTEEAVAELLTV